MKESKLSVIVSVFNTEKYVARCITSILNQTYKNIELIIINDGSTDSSFKIINTFASDKRVIILDNEQNRGLSFSRNRGIDTATGQYIGFIDSDDYIDSNYYEVLMNSIIKEQAEIAVCDMKYQFFDDKNNEFTVKCCNDDTFNKINVIDNGIAASACNKVFKKELFNNNYFAIGKANEDIAVVIPAIVKANKIVYAEGVYYYYIQRNNSIQNSEFKDSRFDIFDGVDATLVKIKGCKDYNKIKDAIIYNQIAVILSNIIPKEKNFGRRYKILKKYSKLSRKYQMRSNWYYWRFIDFSGPKHKVFFKTLYKLNDLGLCFLEDVLISLYSLLEYLMSNKIKLYNYSMEEIINVAKKNATLSEPKKKVSVVIPNYNYARFMNQRVYSVLAQNYKISELIILDDSSSDNSVEVINNIVDSIKEYINVRFIINDKNSGSAFKQWEKGFNNATSDYVWICEADDYCDKKFLKTVMKPVKNDDNILISYTNTAFIDLFGNILIRTIIPEIDIQKTGHWDKSYVNDGMNEILNYSFLNCTIANVSGCVIKRGDYKDYFKMSNNYHQAGDWLFYVNVMQHGKIAYNKKVLNYYRVHGNNVSVTMDHQKHINEINSIHAYFIKQFNLDDKHKKLMEKRIKFLKKAWKLK